MKKLVSFILIGAASFLFASTTAASLAEGSFIEEEIITFEALAGDGLRFMSVNNITVKLSKSKSTLSLIMSSKAPRERDTCIWCIVQLDYPDGTSEIVNFVPTIYAGYNTSAPVVIHDNYSASSLLPSIRVVDATVIFS